MQRILYLQVLDYDRFSRNDPIGEVSIPLNKVDLTQMQTFWKDLKPCSDGSVRPHGWALTGQAAGQGWEIWSQTLVNLRKARRAVGEGADGQARWSSVLTSSQSTGAWHLGGTHRICKKEPRAVFREQRGDGGPGRGSTHTCQRRGDRVRQR